MIDGAGKQNVQLPGFLREARSDRPRRIVPFRLIHHVIHSMVGFGGGACAAPLLSGVIRPRQERINAMPKYIIEREIPGAGSLSQEQLQGISQKSCSVLSRMGPQIQWLQSYVTGDKVYCVYIAPNEEAVREHARQGGFPANRVSQVVGIIDPTTAEA